MTFSPRTGASAISVIVPTHNRSVYLRECLQSILAETTELDKILVVDDGSTDDTRLVIEEFGAAIRARYRENGGKSAALNEGLEHTTRPLIWIIDDDDIVCPGARTHLTGMLEASPETSIAYGRYLRFQTDRLSGNRRISDTGYWTKCAPEDFLIATMEDFFAHQPGLLVRRSLYDRAGPFDETLERSVDYEMLTRLARLGRAAPVDAVVFHQRVHDGRRGHAAGGIEAADREQSWIKYDKHIFSRIYKEFPLAAFLPAGADPSTHRRIALLQRAVIMARKKLWTLTLQDFHAACEVSNVDLSPEERAVVRRALGSKYGCQEIIDDASVRKRVAEIARSSRAGQSIARSLARGLAWRIRSALQLGKITEAFGYVRFAVECFVAGPVRPN